MVTHISHSPEETQKFGAMAAERAVPGSIYALVGDLGAGKTQWVKGFAAGLNVRDHVHSPTFALVNEYSGGRWPLYHLDLYRLDTKEQVLSAGLEPFLFGQGIAVVEWAERWFDPEDATGALVWVRFNISSETEREITYEGAGY